MLLHQRKPVFCIIQNPVLQHYIKSCGLHYSKILWSALLQTSVQHYLKSRISASLKIRVQLIACNPVVIFIGHIDHTVEIRDSAGFVELTRPCALAPKGDIDGLALL